MQVNIKAFKNRELKKIPDSFLQEVFSNGLEWATITGTASRCERIDAKYRGYDAYELKLSMDDFNILPCKALFITKTNSEYKQYLASYKTIRCTQPCQGESGFVLIDLFEDITIPDISHLENRLYFMFGRKGHQTVYVVVARKISPKPSICKDDRTGEYYCYSPTRVNVLKKQD
jgi:hypothetical protein